MKEILRKGPYGRSGSLASMWTSVSLCRSSGGEGALWGWQISGGYINRFTTISYCTNQSMLHCGREQTTQKKKRIQNQREMIKSLYSATRVIIFATTELTTAKQQYVGINSMPLWCWYQLLIQKSSSHGNQLWVDVVAKGLMHIRMIPFPQTPLPT